MSSNDTILWHWNLLFQSSIQLSGQERATATAGALAQQPTSLQKLIAKQPQLLAQLAPPQRQQQQIREPGFHRRPLRPKFVA